ncbi:hypothetical protein GS16_05590 [Candidatus Liberibacter solanacearum]|uniref:hypothetical protein n=1 Tax=Candidatus Liberibacter solanacearum TaxID=556287 RepID=UPI00050715D5|nr:hypothetical protein [Candidatus Liberibacter solanacearum]KGB27191.1 hypothetical protein GS16_05590 [Candidatus Liberibacter solanacearum]KJZ81001.1 hypothetical protein KP07_04155 [Candidatus Liberibacter solanacearum]KQC49392.1 hypothetical protein AP064_02850 [Candidatus Liberibacter solanacearum]
MVINIPEAWPYGPVYPEVYLHIEQYKATPVRYLIQNKQKFLTKLASQKNKNGIIPSGDRYLWQTPF